MLTYGKTDVCSTRKKHYITEGSLIRVFPSMDIKVRIQDPEYGHLLELNEADGPIVGVVTKLWGSGNSVREVELLSSGEFLIVTTSNGLSDLEVLSC